MEDRKISQHEKLLFLNSLTHKEICKLHEKAMMLKIGGCSLACRLFNAYHQCQKQNNE